MPADRKVTNIYKKPCQIPFFAALARFFPVPGAVFMFAAKKVYNSVKLTNRRKRIIEANECYTVIEARRLAGMDVMQREMSFDSCADEARIFVRIVEPADHFRTRGVLQIAHGMAEHSMLY
ncbi:MAG TPA: hypothetical protein IAB66_04305, partial [Candidatus Caccousia avistercoris]|nr:hypothetical protein [Candidatus Caccousia avistercoris]